MTELEGGLPTEMNGMRRFEIHWLDLEIFFVKKLWEIITLNMFPGSCEQAMLNFVYYSGIINSTGITIRMHHMKEGEIISCPEWFSEEELKESENWYIVHHFKGALYRCFSIQFL